MTSDRDKSGANAQSEGKEKPDWATGLKQLYDEVVEEPLPDAFKDLLAQLDADDSASRGDSGDSA